VRNFRAKVISSIELMLDEADYDGEDHKEELEQMLSLLEAARTFDDLQGQAEYRRLLERLVTGRLAAA
jgi:hypothetical protein